ncbi:ABC transporter ATP-binding protein [Kiritimatiellaeota bacterium B1221]|nr:ABC transporter ATP-binding protein [Kiritimatiellaeota bacterium B1221]
MKLSTQNLILRYGSLTAVQRLSVSFSPGELSILVGPNGCGKSTFLRACAGLKLPDEGSVKLDDDLLESYSARKRAQQIALLPQSPMTPAGLTVRGLIHYGRHPHQGLFQRRSRSDDVIVEEAMRDTDITDLADRQVDQLSGGQRQRCWLAMILAQQASVILLDEPTSMLDIGHQCEILSLSRRLAQNGKTVVIVLHDLMAAARYADRLLAFKDGVLMACGRPKDVLTSDVIRRTYGIESRIFHPEGESAPVVIPQM